MNSATTNKPELTRDLFLGEKIILWQDAKGYRAGIDPILLAAFNTPKRSERILDLGCGVGAVSLCLLMKNPQVFIMGLEILKETFELAKLNAAENNLEDNFVPVLGSVSNIPPIIKMGSFDLVVSNPPYTMAKTTNLSPYAKKQIAHVETQANIEIWVKTASVALKHKGLFSFIHRADRLDHLLGALRPFFGGITIHPLWPKSGKQAKRVLIKAKKGSKAPTVLTSGTIIHMNDGSYTPEVDSILKGNSLINFE